MGMNENQIINLIQNQMPTELNQGLGLSDDAALIPGPTDSYWVITTDLLTEGVHFDSRYYKAQELAQKALAVNFSDLAAMGSKPKFIFLSLALPQNTSEEWTRLFLNTLAQESLRNDCVILGGDTTSSKTDLFISLTAIGLVQKDRVKLRSTAQPGDLIYVTGPLGEARLGLEFLSLPSPQAAEKHLITRQKTPQPQIAKGIFLGSKDYVTSMMDLSDGLLLDLEKLVTSSDVGAEVHAPLPGSPELKHACEKLQRSLLSEQIMGGEDYQLLFTISSASKETFIKEYENRFKTSPFAIGTINDQKKVTYFLESGEEFDTTSLKPYQHL